MGYAINLKVHYLSQLFYELKFNTFDTYFTLILLRRLDGLSMEKLYYLDQPASNSYTIYYT